MEYNNKQILCFWVTTRLGLTTIRYGILSHKQYPVAKHAMGRNPVNTCEKQPIPNSVD
jgi:hypothetical protein